jgi:hypothetical protein
MVASRRAYDLVHVVQRGAGAQRSVIGRNQGPQRLTLHVEYNSHMWEATVSETKPTDESQ